MESTLLYSQKDGRRLAIQPKTNANRKANYVLVLETLNKAVKGGGNNANCTARFQPSATFQSSDYSPLIKVPVYGCLGLVLVDNEPFVCLITDCQRVGDVEDSQIYRVNNVMFFSLVSDKYDDLVDNGAAYIQQKDFAFQPNSLDAPQAETEVLKHPCQPLQRFLCSGSFYYSYDFDLTRCASIRFAEKNLEYAGFWESSDERFFWNRYIIKELLKFRKQLPEVDQRALDQEGILVMAISGFIRIEDVSYCGENCKVVLISRLSCKRAGTRFNTRGLDDDGSVANNVETEILVYFKDLVYSNVIIRGSVPVFWEQQGLQLGQHRIQLTRSFEATHPATERHFNDSVDRYGKIHIVNLLGSKEGSADLVLTEAFRSHVAKLNQVDYISMTNFDFHQFVKGNNYDNLSLLLNQLRDVIKNFGFFLFNRKANEVLFNQSGVFRVNCLDCLDRTNVVQGLLCKAALNLFIVPFVKSSADTFFSMCLNDQWADNGDELSRIYTGTGALKSGFTRTGKRTLAGFMDDAKKSATRFYQNNFQDKYKQEVIDLLLGKLANRNEIRLFNPIREAVVQALQSRFSEFASIISLNVHVATWNVNGKQPQGESLVPWLKFDQADYPDIFVVGFQEIVELSPQQIMATDSSKRLGWEDLLLRTLNSIPGSNYVLLRSGQLVGAALIILAKAPLVAHLRNVDIAIKKTGFAGLAGNKGGVAIRMDIYDTSVCFLCAHLAAGHSNVEDRNQDYNIINDGVTFSKGRKIRDHEMIFFFGDFNYRIDMPYDDVMTCVKRRDIDYLLQNDQLINQMKKEYCFPNFKEGQIRFLPTYKYDNGTNDYDTSEKQRIPAWTDRILFQGQGINLLSYDRAELMSSDHKPVKGLFQLDVKSVKKDVKERIQQELYKKFTEMGFGANLTSITSPASSLNSSVSNAPTTTTKFDKLIDLGDSGSSNPPIAVTSSVSKSDFNWWDDNAFSNQVKNLDINSSQPQVKNSPLVPKKPAHLQASSLPQQNFVPLNQQNLMVAPIQQGPPHLPVRRVEPVSHADTSLFNNSNVNVTNANWGFPTTTTANFNSTPAFVQQKIYNNSNSSKYPTQEAFADPFADPWSK